MYICIDQFDVKEITNKTKKEIKCLPTELMNKTETQIK